MYLSKKAAGSIMLVRKQLEELSKQAINNVVRVGVINLFSKAGLKASLKFPESKQEKLHLVQPPRA